MAISCKEQSNPLGSCNADVPSDGDDPRALSLLQTQLLVEAERVQGLEPGLNKGVKTIKFQQVNSKLEKSQSASNTQENDKLAAKNVNMKTNMKINMGATSRTNMKVSMKTRMQANMETNMKANSSWSVEKPGQECAPKCNYNCTEPVCNHDCKAKCQAPKCETRCSQDPELHRCKMDCDEPDCAVVCPETGQNDQTENFPNCTTECTKPQCKLKCPEQDCKEVCEVPACQWDCDMSKCPKPDCKLECEEQTEFCSTHAEIPEMEEGQAVIRSFEAPLSLLDIGTAVETVTADVVLAASKPGSSEVVLTHRSMTFPVA